MTKRTTFLAAMVLFLLGVGVSANAIDRKTLAQYASSLKGLSKAELKEAIYNISQPSTVLSYGSGIGKTWSGFYKTDRIGNTLECRNRYSTARFYFASTNSTTAISGMNIEHSFPKSWWGGTKNNAYKDLFNLYPSESTANSAKSNYVMGKVTNPYLLDDYEKVGTGDQGSVKMVEPHDNWKGDFCRSYFYMVTTYQNLTWTSEGLNCLENDTYPTLQEWAYTLYLDWTRTDKVDSIEVARNNAIYDIQGNRNLYIDYPYLAEYVWGDSTNFDPYTSVTTASDDDRYLKSGTSSDSDVVDDVYYFTAATSVTPGDEYLIVADNDGTLEAMTALSTSRSYGYIEPVEVTETNDTIVLSDTANVYVLEADGSNYLIRDANNRYLWHDGTYKTISVSDDDRDGSYWTITPNGDGTFKVAFSDGYYIQYSTTYSSYGCYADEQGLMPKLYQRVSKNATAIKSVVKTTAVDQNGRIYTLQGQYVGNSFDNLPAGLYIRNGKKIIIK